MRAHLELHLTESVETLVFARAFREWPELRAAGTR
jgi:hypothetical protein